MPVVENRPAIALDHVLFATDFSPASEAAQAYAEAIARRYTSELTVATVIDLSVTTRSEAALVGIAIDRMRHDTAENMERALERLGGSGLRVNGRSIEAHHPAAAVLRLLDRNTDLLVIGSHGRHGLERFILGSFAEEVIHRAKCPVLTIGPHSVPPPAGALSFTTILFATDLSHSTVEKAAVALAFAQDSVARIHLCHVIEQPSPTLTAALSQEFGTEAALRSLIPDAAYDWCSPECAAEFGKPAERILALAASTEADLIVLGARRTAVSPVHFVRGVAAKVIAEAKCPVMTICSE